MIHPKLDSKHVTSNDRVRFTLGTDEFNALTQIGVPVHWEGRPMHCKEKHEQKNTDEYRQSAKYVLLCILYCTRINKRSDYTNRAQTAFKSSSFLFPGVTLSLVYSWTDNSFDLFSLHTIYLV